MLKHVRFSGAVMRGI